MPTLDESVNYSIEGFGITYIEAAFFGIPSVASNIGGTPEAVKDKLTGIIINNLEDLYDCMNDLLSNKNKRILLGQNAKNRSVKEFNWKNVCNNYLIAFSKILSDFK